MTDLDATRLSNAKGLYLEGIRDGRPREAQAKYSGARYRQHSTGVPDGKEGFIEFFDDFLARNPSRDIQVIRGWVDGPLVFLHVYQSLNDGAAQWVTADFFDTDDAGKLIEHWDVIGAFTPQTAAGHTNIDGTTALTDHAHTEANKRVVRQAIETLAMRGADPANAAEFVDLNGWVQHGVGGLGAVLAEPDGGLYYERVVLLAGCGNFVATLCETSRGDDRFAQVDVFRLHGGVIVEHWNVVEPVPPPEQLANSGKF